MTPEGKRPFYHFPMVFLWMFPFSYDLPTVFLWFAAGNCADAHETLDLCGCAGPFGGGGQGARLERMLRGCWGVCKL